MYNINQPHPFSSLKEFYIPAIHHPIMLGKKKMFNLSIPLDGKEVQIKRSTKKIKHTSYAKVVLGAVLRMQKLFKPDKLNLGVIINCKPSIDNLTLEFELVNTNKFLIGSEEYFLSIVAKYSYTNPDKVTYFPILYRQSCTNGAVSILNEQFKEVLSVEKILEVSCEWTRCNFESYKNKVNSYFEQLRRTIDHPEKLREHAERLSESLFNLKKNRKKTENKLMEYDRSIHQKSVSSLYLKYAEEIGNNQFAVLNAITDYASQEPDYELRYQFFISIGKYLSKEMNKVAKLDKEYWSDSLDWQSLNKMIQ